MHGANAEASSSRTQLDTVRSRSRPGKARASVGAASASLASLSPVASSFPSTSTRKVRTVPPSAVFEPPTPPPVDTQPTFDTHRPAAPTKQDRPRPPRRKKIRYESSSGASSSSSADESDDDVPPWWTFTQRGMTRLRAMGDRAAGAGRRGSISADPADGAVTEPDSGREGPPKDRDWRRRRSRIDRTDKEKKRSSGGSPSRGGPASGVSTPTARSATTRLFHPRPFRVAPSAFGRRSSEQSGPPAFQVGGEVAPEMARSNSAPISPVTGSPPRHIPISLSGTDTPPPAGAHMSSPETRRPSADKSDAPDVSPRRPTMRHLMSMPIRRSSMDGNLTDSEVLPASPRKRALQKHLWDYMSRVPEEGHHPPHDLSDTTGTPSGKKRMNAQNLRIRLPPPITQHFVNGWPHAGSWQDALRNGGMFDDDLARHSRETPTNGLPTGLVPPLPTTQSDDGLAAHSRLSRDIDAGQAGSTDTDGTNTGAATPRHPVRPSAHHRTSAPPPTRSSSEAPYYTPSARSSKQHAKRRTKKSKPGRYRPTVQIPPTPGPHGYGRSLELGAHDWGHNETVQPAADPNTNPFDRLDHFDHIDEELSLSPQQTRSEKGKGNWGLLSRFRRKRPRTAYDDLTWRQRFRRMLLLDARVTIYIRLWNLATVVVLLALAITIRRKLESIGYSGVLGSSTTLIISYASFTVVHVMTAIFREYFGRPVGLWGLRSKMLWVCLDLLFVALWSSALTLAINDYIDTPLDCTPLTPWWTPGVDYYSSGDNGSAVAAVTTAVSLATEATVPASVKNSEVIHDVCRRQVGCFSIALVTLLLYCGNMVLSLFRIFETVRRTAPYHPQHPNAV